MSRVLRKSLVLSGLLITVLFCMSACKSKTEEQKDTTISQLPDTGIAEVTAAPKDNNDITDTLDGSTGMEDGYWSFQTCGGIASSPIIKNNVIYFGSKDGYLYAVDLTTKKQLWRYYSENAILCQPAIFKNSIFFVSKENYFALDIKTGAELWVNNLTTDVMKKIRNDEWDYHDSSPVIDNGVVYFGSGVGEVVGFDINTGEAVWQFNTLKAAMVRSTPLIKDGIMYFGDWKGNFYAVDIATKETKWVNSYNNSTFESTPYIYNGAVYFGGRDYTIHAVSIEDGAALWSYTDSGSWISGEPIVQDNILYYPSSDSHTVFAMNPSSGEIIQKYDIYKNSFSRVVIINNILYVTSGDARANPGTGKLQAFDLNGDGKSVWEFDRAAIFTSPVVQDDVIYFGCEDGYLYGVDLKQVNN